MKLLLLAAFAASSLGLAGCAGPASQAEWTPDEPDPFQDRPDLLAVLQKVLETQPSDTPVRFRAPEGGATGSVVVTSTVRRTDGVFCRTFEVRIDGPPEEPMRGLGCRTADGAWAIQA